MENVSASRKKWFLLCSPFFVLLFTRAGVEISISYFPMEAAWIPSFIAYYSSIALIILVGSRYFLIRIRETLDLKFRIKVSVKTFVLGIVIPSLLPVGAFIAYAQSIPLEYIIYILIFSCINPIFEEGFWRGLLYYIPATKTFTIFYTAFLFSFSHYFLWGCWFNHPIILLPTLFSTFIMGIAWMWFLQKEKNIVFPIISHFIVDVLNLSVAVYSGLVPAIPAY